MAMCNCTFMLCNILETILSVFSFFGRFILYNSKVPFTYQLTERHTFPKMSTSIDYVAIGGTVS